MKKRISILQFSLEVAVILLLVVTMVSSIVNHNLDNRCFLQEILHRETEFAVSEEEIPGPAYLKFPDKPYTKALYENKEEKEKWSESVILKKPRVMEIEGHPFTGNTSYEPLTDTIKEVQDEITFSPFDYTQKVDLYVKLPDDKKTTWNNDSHKSLVLDQEKIPGKLNNHLLCYSIHLPDLYNNARFSFSPYNVVLLDSDGKTPIPYWVQDDNNKEILVWTRLPVYDTALPKSLYIAVNENLEYPTLDSSYAFSNFDSVFTKQESNITGQYQFRLNKLGEFQEALDLSGNHNHGKIFGFDWDEYESGPSVDWHSAYKEIFFTKDVYCKIQNNNQSVLSLQNGSIEMIIDYRGGGLGSHGSGDHHYFSPKNFSDKKAIFFEDTNKNFSIYYFQGALCWNFVKNHQLMQMRIPLSKQFLYDRHLEFHVFCSWNQSSNQYDFYLDGQKQDNTQITTLSKTKSNEIGDLIIGESSDSSSFSYSFIPSVFFYDRYLGSAMVSKLTNKHWNAQNLLLSSVLESFQETFEKEVPDFKNIESGDSFYYDLFYIAPNNNEYSRGYYNTFKIKDREVNLLFKDNTDWQPVFGIHNHFYSHVGTYIESKKPCMVEYVELKISHPELIKELSIEFLYTSHTDFGKENTESVELGKWFDWIELAWGKLIPSVEACGPFYSHKKYGSTLLEFISSEKDVYLYRLKEPIYIDENADFMQIQYKNTNQLGLLSLKVEDIYVFSDNQYSKGVYAPDMPMKYSRPYSKEWNQEKQTFEINTFRDNPTLLYPDFQVVLLGQEKGCVSAVVQNQGKELAFSFTNEGPLPITITEESLLAIQTFYGDKKWVGLQLLPYTKYGADEENTIEIDLPFHSLLGKTIQPGDSIILPSFQWKKYKRKKGFKDANSVLIRRVTVVEKSPSLPIFSLEMMKIIQWSDVNWNYSRYDEPWSSFKIKILPDDKIEIAD